MNREHHYRIVRSRYDGFLVMHRMVQGSAGTPWKSIRGSEDDFATEKSAEEAAQNHANLMKLRDKEGEVVKELGRLA